MKPVKKGTSPKQSFSSYDEAKPDLIARLGSHCSYCEAHRDTTAIAVEHIYPKAYHPQRENDWENFLIACESCNSKKHAHFGSGRKRGLLKRYLWPHIDNTARAFVYSRDGRVSVAESLPPAIQKMAEKTKDMVGLMSSPAKAKIYAKRAVAYSGLQKRNQAWRMAESIKLDYLENPQPARARRLAEMAIAQGHFSVWMEVFDDRPEFRKELILAFKADAQCFDQDTRPVLRGRI